MIKTRLMGLLSHAKKYIAYTILWQWATLLSQVSSSEVVQVSTEGVKQLETYFGKYLPSYSTV